MNKQLDFSGTTIFCGVDVHKKSWRVNIQDSDFELEDFTQNSDAVLLHKHLNRRYPNATFKIGYEAGFSGFSVQRLLSKLGNDCLVINAADIPSGDKERRRKHDKTDARKLCDHLQSRKVQSIYIPDSSWEHARTLVRTRERIVNNQTRSKNRIWQLLHFSGLAAPLDHQEGRYWSRRFNCSFRTNGFRWRCTFTNIFAAAHKRLFTHTLIAFRSHQGNMQYV